MSMCATMMSMSMPTGMRVGGVRAIDG